MKAKTRYNNADGGGYVFFCYEDDRGNAYGSYDELERYGRPPYVLIGYIYSHYFGGSEALDIMDVPTRPTLQEVKKFMKGCLKYIGK